MGRIVLCLACLCTISCGLDNPPTPQTLDREHFRCRVQPVLITRCAFYACHGDPARPYVVFGPNRLRLDVGELARDAELSPAEQVANYEAALAFASPHEGYDLPLLLAKPMAPEIGGGYHGTLDLYEGRDVFHDPDNPELAILRAWTRGTTEDPSCEP